MNDNIDMKNRQIKNVGDGNENADAVNVKQLNEVETNINDNKRVIRLIMDYIFDNNEKIKIIKELYFSDSNETNNGVQHIFYTTGGNEGDYTFYYVFQHNTSTNDEMIINIFYLGLTSPIKIFVNKTRLLIGQASNQNKSFNIPNNSLGKQVWFRIWTEDRKMQIIFSALSPIKFPVILDNPDDELNVIRVDFTPFTEKRGLITTNIYDNNSEAYQKIKVFEESEGTIT